MTCLWREAVDGMVDDSDDSLLWKYADMLAGWDLVRYLIAEDRAGQQDRGLRKTRPQGRRGPVGRRRAGQVQPGRHRPGEGR